MNTTRFLSITVLSLLSACGGGGGGGDEASPFDDVPVTTTDFVFSLSAQQVIDGTPANDSSGTATFQTRARGTLEVFASGTLVLRDIDATRVDIHFGFAGETGPVILALQQQDPMTWAIPANTEIDIDELRLLEQTALYVRVSSPQGVIRGQILPAGWGIVMFDLSGESVVPEVLTGATGRGGLTLQAAAPDGRHTYHLRVTTNNLADAIGGSLADAYAGANGNERLSLMRSLAAPSVWGTGDVNDLNFEPFLTVSGLEPLGAGQLHVVIRSAANPEGEIRGQIVPDGVEALAVPLSTDQVVTGVPVVAPGSATAMVTYNEFTGDIAINLHTDIQNAISVSLHEAPAGQDGVLLLSLFRDFSVPGLWSLPVTTLTTQQQAALASDNLYLQLTTVDYPNGALRGQIIQPAAGVGAN